MVDKLIVYLLLDFQFQEYKTIKIEKIIRSKRNIISLHICEDTTLLTKAPNNASNEMINRVIIKHKNWVEKKKREVQSRDLKFIKKEFLYCSPLKKAPF